jgi:outer membrane receptor protein involved in Fe transport
VIYRGFEASPLPGNSQGLAVYLDGSRFNQPFGDTVDWDLIPDTAIDTLDVVASNPAFGLNALGGAISVRLKDGFSHRGGAIEVSGGSFGRRGGSVEYGRSDGPIALYVAGASLDEDGWRDFSPSRLRQGYADAGWKGEAGEFHANLLLADNDLTGNGAAPVELLESDRSAVFTHPDRTQNRYARMSFSGDWQLNANWTLKATAYGARLVKTSVNGDAAEVEPCESDGDQLCSEDGDFLTDTAGEDVANFLIESPYITEFPAFAAGGPYAYLNHTRTRTSSWGAGFQATRAGELFGLHHRIAMGASVDVARTQFEAGTTIGGLSLDRGWFGPDIEIDTPDANITPVSVNVNSTYLGLFASDGIELTRDVTLTITARANEARVRLIDQLGMALNGKHTFRRVDPAIGVSWRAGDGVALYGGYSEASRAPTPAELSCADPDAPCSLTNFFVADPPLNQVVGRTIELGARGEADIAYGLSIGWHAGAYRTDIDDDIQLIASETAGRGFFANVGKTRRQGVELGASAANAKFDAYVDYAWTEATNETQFNLNAGANPAFDDESDAMTVMPGAHRPGVPEHSLKVGIDWLVDAGLTVGADGVGSSGRYLVGDEANLNPKTDSYWLMSLHAKYRVAPGFEIFAEVTNVFDTDYETFGAFSPVGAVPVSGLGELTNPRSLSPGAPRAAYAGLRVLF